jgi:broad specificity phosphatase PhoE
MTDLILLRHGETVGQSSIRLYGATDIALSPIGEQQVSRAAAVLKDHRFARVLSSPLQRARRSAEIVLATLTDAPPLELVPGFREIDFGAWEGWTYAEAEARDPDGYARWQTEGHSFTYPGGESRSGFLARIAAAAATAIDPARGPTLAVLHKGVIRATLAALIGRPTADLADLAISLASLHRLRHDGARWQLLSTGETAHLGDLDLGG